MADEQPPETVPKRLSDCISNFSYTHWREVTEFENISSQKSGRSIVIDFQMNNIHTSWYVKELGYEAKIA